METNNEWFPTWTIDHINLYNVRHIHISSRKIMVSRNDNADMSNDKTKLTSADISYFCESNIDSLHVSIPMTALVLTLLIFSFYNIPISSS